MRLFAARMHAAHALLESRPERRLQSSSPLDGDGVVVQRVLSQVWRNGQACVRASLTDGSVRVVPVDKVDANALISFKPARR